MKIFLASVESTGSFRKNMQLYLAESGGLWGSYFIDKYFKDVYILQSFYYADEFTEKYIIPNVKDFLLDSGAFTFMQNTKKGVDWEEYVKRYAEFINKNDIKKFFELDIDSVVGYGEVIRYREILENLTKKKCIPVWHRGRGYNEWISLCNEYDYTAIGGIAIKEIQKKEYPAFTKMLRDAHKRGCRVHGLGFTQINELKKYRFDSVDSTAWTAGNRFGFMYYFDGKTMRKIMAGKNQRIIDPQKAALINYAEWVKFQKYAERNL